MPRKGMEDGSYPAAGMTAQVNKRFNLGTLISLCNANLQVCDREIAMLDTTPPDLH